jgi:hypothetical protein
MENKTSQTDEPRPLNKHGVVCCGVLEQMLIAWMVLPDGKKVMPYIPGENGEMWRVNHCPSCGAYVRDASKP